MHIRSLDGRLQAENVRAEAALTEQTPERRALGDRYNQSVIKYGHTIGRFVDILRIAAPTYDFRFAHNYDYPAQMGIAIAKRATPLLGEGTIVACLEGFYYSYKDTSLFKATWRDLDLVQAMVIGTTFAREDAPSIRLGEDERYEHHPNWAFDLNHPDAFSKVEALEEEVNRQAQIATEETLPMLYEAMQDPTLNPHLAPYAGRLATESAI